MRVGTNKLRAMRWRGTGFVTTQICKEGSFLETALHMISNALSDVPRGEALFIHFVFIFNGIHESLRLVVLDSRLNAVKSGRFWFFFIKNLTKWSHEPRKR